MYDSGYHSMSATIHVFGKVLQELMDDYMYVFS